MSINYYDENAEKFFDNTFQLNMKDIYQKFTPNITNGGKILDAGCGSGRDVKAFIEMGYDVIGFDSSIEMVQMSKKLSKSDNIFHLDFNDVEWENEFDGVWACASLLHVTEKDFQSVGKKIYKSLKKDAPFYLSFKYGYKSYTKDNRFFQCHDENSLKKEMNKIGLFLKDEFWLTHDIRPDRKDEKWLNAIYIKG